MKNEDLQWLGEDYEQAVDSTPDTQLARRLGVECPHVRDLVNEVLGDLDGEKYGVGWWAPHPGTRRRIFISDYLYQALSGIEDNLIEARLHLLEYVDAHAQQNVLMADCVQRHPETGEVHVKHPRPRSAVDQLPRRLATLHVAGFCRAINSAHDCLAAATVAVAAIPLDIKKTSLGQVRWYLRNLRAGDAVTLMQKRILSNIEDAAAGTGPLHWERWIANFRHMFIHRGRRMSLSHLEQRRPVLAGPDGLPILRADTVHVLPHTPGWTEIEALLRPELGFALTEPAETTLSGVLNSAREFIDTVSSILVGLWHQRRTDPLFALQPREQWPGARGGRGPVFHGYAPGTAPADGDLLSSAPSLTTRLVAAALTDGQRTSWDNFD